MSRFAYCIYFLIFFGSLMSSACYSDQPVELLAERFQQHYQKGFSGEGSPMASFATLRARLDSINTYQHDLTGVDTHALSDAGKAQRRYLQMALHKEWEQWVPYQDNPAMYNIGGLLKQELVSSVAIDKPDRLQRLVDIMDQSDDYYAAARKNLIVGDISLYRLAAQKQYLGLEFLKKEFRDSLRLMALKAEDQRLLEEKVNKTSRALKDYLAFCESIFLNYQDSTRYQRPSTVEETAGSR